MTNQNTWATGEATFYFSTVVGGSGVTVGSKPVWGVNVKDTHGNVYKHPSTFTVKDAGGSYTGSTATISIT